MLKKLPLFFILSYSCLVLNSCTSMQTEMSKKWKLDKSVFPLRERQLNEFTQEQKNIKDSIAATSDSSKIKKLILDLELAETSVQKIKEGIEKLNHSYLDLNEDGSYSSTVAVDEEGSWNLSSDKKILCLIPKGKNRTDTFYIKEFEREKLLVLAIDSSTFLSFSPQE